MDVAPYSYEYVRLSRLSQAPQLTGTAQATQAEGP